MNRKQWILAVALAVQALLLVLVHGAAESRMMPAEAHTLFASLASFTPAKVEIRGAGDDEAVTLDYGTGHWAIEQADGYPADDAKVGQFLKKLSDLKVRRPVVTSSRYHEALKVTEKDHERKVRIWKDGEDKPAIQFFLGTSPNYRRTHIRKIGDDNVYSAQGLGTYDVQPSTTSWFESRFVNVELGWVHSFRLENSHGSFEAKKGDDGGWTVVSPKKLQGHALDKTNVETLLRTATSLRATEPAGRRDDAAQGLDSPAATMVLRYAAPTGGDQNDTQEGAVPEQELSIRIGGATKDEDSRVYVARSGFDFVAEAYKTSVDKLLDETAATLEVKAETS